MAPTAKYILHEHKLCGKHRQLKPVKQPLRKKASDLASHLNMTMPKYAQLQGDQPPEYIHLPDGRSVPLRDIMGRRTEYQSIRIGVKPSGSFAGRKIKYSPEEREWIATSSMGDVQRKYKLETWLQAWSMITYHRKLLGLPKASRKTWPR
jgi:hypothetical protein